MRPVGADVSELRINHGPGDRVYELQRGTTLTDRVAGGDAVDLHPPEEMAAYLETGIEVASVPLNRHPLGVRSQQLSADRCYVDIHCGVTRMIQADRTHEHGLKRVFGQKA